MSKPSELEQKLHGTMGKVLVGDHIRGDPDSIASKFTVAYMLRKHFNLDVTVTYSKSTGHPQNEYMVALFEALYQKPIPSIETLNLDDFEWVFLVDTNLTATNLPFTEAQMGLLKQKKVAILDHHTPRDAATEIIPSFLDAGGMGVSATATRITEYLKAYNMMLKKEDPEEKLLATALIYGIEVDSSNRPKNKRDYEAIIYLLDAMDPQLKRKIARCGWNTSTIRKFGEAIAKFKEENSEFLGSYALGFIGEIKQNVRHIVAEISDTLIEIDSVDTAIGTAVTDDGIEISIRTKERCKVNAEDIAKRFGGGGRDGSAGASIPLSRIVKRREDLHLLPEQSFDALLEEICIDYIKNALQ